MIDHDEIKRLIETDPVTAYRRVVGGSWADNLISVPRHSHKGLVRWILLGIYPGGFLTAVLEGDLYEALGRADEINRHALWDYANFLYNHSPSGCFKTKERVKDWHLKGGLLGMEAEPAT